MTEGQSEEAVGNYRRAVKMMPEDPVVIFNLAATLLEGSVDIDEAIVLYERTQRYNRCGSIPDDTSYHTVM